MNKRRYFDDLASRWDALPGPPDAREKTSAFVERMALGHAACVVDVGCGTGVLVQHLARVLPPRARIVELDFAQAMVRESLRKHGTPRVAGVCADARRLPLATGSCHAVLCFGVFPHLGDPRHALGELLRPLRPGGIFGVGHLMDSRDMNAFHASLGEPVAADHLPPVTILAAHLRDAGAHPTLVEEEPGWYCVRATTES